MAFYGYARVSTEKQVEEGVSLEAQADMLHGLAAANRGKLEAVFYEKGVSGSVHVSARPEGARLMEIVGAGDTIIVTRLDRLFRSALDAFTVLEQIHKKGARIIFGDIGASDSANGKLIIGILAVVSQAERDMLKERIRAVKQSQAKEGRYLGGKLPFGFEQDGEGGIRLTPEGDRLRKEMKRHRDAGKSLRAIAEIMAAQGVRLSHTGVRDAIAAEEAAAAKPAQAA